MNIRLIAIVMVAIGLAGFFMPFWIGSLPKGATALELPVADVADAAVSDSGELFIGLGFLGRVQKYSATGQFLENFALESSGGAFCLDIRDDVLTVYMARRDAAGQYGLDGNLIRRDIPISEQKYRESCALDPAIEGIEYAFDSVTVVLKDANQPINIDRQAWHYLAYNPFVSWLLFVVGLALIPEWRNAVFGKFFEKRGPAPSPDTARPKGVLLKTIDFVLNIIITLIHLVICAIFLLLFSVIGHADPNFPQWFDVAIAAFIVGVSLYGIYKLWTTYDGRIRTWFGRVDDVGPAGYVLWKASSVATFAAFITLVVYLGALPKAGGLDDEPEIKAQEREPINE